MATQLADSPQAEAPAPGGGAPGVPAPETPIPPTPGTEACARCGAAMVPGQDWCLECGSGAPGSVAGGGARTLVTVLVVTAVLVLGAAAAGYAALSKKSRHAPIVTRTVAQAPPVAATATPVPPVTTTPTPGLTIKPPKIPLKAATPPPSATTPAITPTTPASTPTTGASTPSSSGGTGKGAQEPQPEALLLDTNAASTYNPYAYPASWFGDPSLAIDGDTTTGWSALVDPATAPNLAEGLLIDLKSAQKLSFVKLVTSTPGITVQVYGSPAKTVPASITDKAWVPLSKSVTVAKRHAKLVLRNRKKSYRFVTLWISKAPASSVGTPEAPGKITIDELELLPAK